MTEDGLSIAENESARPIGEARPSPETRDGPAVSLNHFGFPLRERRKLGVCGCALLFVAIAGLVIRLTLISGSMPYVGHIDEKEISQRAVGILQTGDFNPHFFEYPSLPIYLATIGFTVGFLDACGKQKIRNSSQIGSVDYPFYSQPTVVHPARVLFAVLSILSLAFLALITYELTGLAVCLFLAPLIASASTVYLFLSWKYLNVDIVGAFFVMATLSYLLWHRDTRWSYRDSLNAGVLCGLTVACKYTLFPILLPGFLMIWFSRSETKVIQSGVLMGAAAVGFLVATPYALLDFSTFLNDVGAAAYHYGRGHPGFEATPGWHQTVYYVSHIVGDFGPLSPILAFVGAAYVLSSNWRRGTAFLSFPIAHLAYLSIQRAHFVRHETSSFLLFAALIAIGLVAVPRSASEGLSYTRLWIHARRIGSAIGAISLVALVYTLPWGRIADAYDLTPDSRNLAVQWIKSNLADGATIRVPPELGLRTGALEKRFRLLPIDFHQLDPSDLAPGSYVLLPRYGYDSRQPRGMEAANMRNEAVARLKVRVLVEMGKEFLAVNYREPIAAGNPSIRIAELEDDRLFKGPR